MSWREQAACEGSTLDWFAIEGTRDCQRALRVCQTCRVTRECLEDALLYENEAADTWGVRGGMLASERQKIRRAA